MDNETTAALLIRVQRLRRNVMQEHYKNLGLTVMQTFALKFTVDHPGHMQKELAYELGIKPSALVSILNALEERGLIERSIDAKNRRITKISITEAGLALVNEIHKIDAQTSTLLCAGFNELEIAQFNAYLMRVIENCHQT